MVYWLLIVFFTTPQNSTSAVPRPVLSVLLLVVALFELLIACGQTKERTATNTHHVDAPF